MPKKKTAKAWPARVRTLRKRLGLSQEAFAQRLHVSFVSVSRWETGRSTPSRIAQSVIIAAEEGVR